MIKEENVNNICNILYKKDIKKMVLINFCYIVNLKDIYLENIMYLEKVQA